MKQPPTSPKPKRPGGHGSYRIGGDPPGPVPGGHEGRGVHASSGRFDDGVVHTPHYGADGHDDLHNEDVAHEHADVSIRGVVGSAVAMAAITIFAMVAMAFLFGQFEKLAAEKDPVVPPVAAPGAEMPPSFRDTPYFSTGIGGPRLLTNEPMVLRDQRAKEAAQLHGYGWVNQGAGVAHIPIDDAKKLLLQRGVPVREGEPVAPTLGTRLPAAGEASSGRVITTAPPERTAESSTPPAHGAAPPHKPGGN